LLQPRAWNAVDPNPFSEAARFTLSLQRAQHVRIAAFNSLGQRVALLHDGPLPHGPDHKFIFGGSGLAAGLYLLTVTGERFRETIPVVLIR
jgi:hypothetical protein